MQQKDIVYIDVEDDITAIIGKVRDAKEKIVALVPPKRTGVLQSAVNLRLLSRAAEGVDKRIVLITGNAALGSLAAAANIPVAKNLQSRPQLAKVPEPKVEEEDVIEGDQLPVGDHAKMTDNTEEESVPEDSIKDIDIDGEPTLFKGKKSKASAAGASGAAAKARNAIKVPDFGSFRKRLALGIGAGILAVLFLVWAIVIAPHATIVVSAKTTDNALSTPVTLGPDLATDAEKGVLKSIKHEEKVTQTIDFDATGTKDVGEKATGTVKFSTNSISMLGTTIPSGTNLTSTGGLVFITTQSVTFNLNNYNGANVGIVAAASGTTYNGASGNMSGVPSGVSAQIQGTTSGGTEKIIKIVSQADVEKAQEQLAENNQEEVKEKLKDKFNKGDVIIEESFIAGDNDPKSSPAVGLEAVDGKAKLTSEIIYTMVGVAKDEMDVYLDAAFGGMLTNKDDQRIYDNGLDSVKFEEYKGGEKSDTAILTATAKVGPQINEDDVKQQVKGKREGEIVGDLKAIDGISDVDVQLSPFWVQGVPDDVKKISIKFKLD